MNGRKRSKEETKSWMYPNDVPPPLPPASPPPPPPPPPPLPPPLPSEVSYQQQPSANNVQYPQDPSITGYVGSYVGGYYGQAGFPDQQSYYNYYNAQGYEVSNPQYAVHYGEGCYAVSQFPPSASSNVVNTQPQIEEGELMNFPAPRNITPAVNVSPVVNVSTADIDDSDDWRKCNVCDLNFEDEKAYNRHCRGLTHTQRLLSRECDAGLMAHEKPAPVEVVDETLFRRKTVDPDKRDLMPNEVGGANFNERWFCHHCNCPCSGYDSFEAHLKGKRHAKTLKNKIVVGIIVDQPVAKSKILPSAPTEVVETGCRAFIQDKVDASSDPLIGLRFVVEYISATAADAPRYICNLCQAKCDQCSLFAHLVGQKHRLRYMKEVRSDIYAEIQMCCDKELQADLLIQRSVDIEQEEGRAQILQRRELLAPSVAGTGMMAEKATVENEAINRLEHASNWDRKNSGNNNKRNRGGQNSWGFEGYNGKRNTDSYYEGYQEKRPRYHNNFESAGMPMADPYYGNPGWYNENAMSSNYGYEQPNYNNAGYSNAYEYGLHQQPNYFEEPDQGYYGRERNYQAYDELYVKPFEKPEAEVTTIPEENEKHKSPQQPAINNGLKFLLLALAQASLKAADTNEDASRMIGLITKAILRVKQQKIMQATKCATNGVTSTKTTPASNAVSTPSSINTDSRPASKR